MMGESERELPLLIFCIETLIFLLKITSRTP